MTYIINDECTKCGDCVEECPVECITEGDEKMIVDADECIDCGTCAEVCPVDAPVEAE